MRISIAIVAALTAAFTACQPMPPPPRGGSPAQRPPSEGTSASPGAGEKAPGAARHASLDEPVRVALAERMASAELTAGPAGSESPSARVVVRLLPAGQLSVTERSGSTRQVAGPFVLDAPGQDGWVGYGDQRYRGSLVVREAPGGGLNVVNVVPVEEYLRGVVPLEIGGRSPELFEAVKAQAVAARTYAWFKRGQYEERGFDLYATVQDQVYRGIGAEEPHSDRAIQATAGEVLVYRGELVRTYYFSTCGGQTARIEDVWQKPPAPYLRGVDDRPRGAPEEESYCRGSRHFRWEERWTGKELAAVLARHLPEETGRSVEVTPQNLRDVRVESRGASGRVKWLEIQVGDETFRIFGDRLRWVLRPQPGGPILRSARVRLETRRGGGRLQELIAHGSGSGHGVGMCQSGALGMSSLGRNYREILEHYYPGSEIVPASRAAF